MANIMSMTQVKNKPSRNGFDLSSKRNFTAKVGELLPVWFKPIVPGDKVKINLSSFTRTAPLNTAAFARLREYYDFYFVPLESLWNKSPEVLTQMLSNGQHATAYKLSDSPAYSGEIPYITAEQIADLVYRGNSTSNVLGYKYSYTSAKLAEYLGYGSFYTTYADADVERQWSDAPRRFNSDMNIFPALAYQCIYNSFFRHTQWEVAQPWTFNVDFIKGTNDLNVDLSQYELDSSPFTLRYCNYQKDLFHGCLPQAQYGEESSVATNADYQFTNISPTSKAMYNWGTVAGAMYITQNASGSVSVDKQVTSFGSIPILALRQAEFLQKWKEVAQSASEDYKAQIQAHWGVSVSDYLSHAPRYLGGTTASLDINEVVNQTIVESFGADIAGKGYINNNGTIEFESKGEYGIIMCIYHALPLVDYTLSGPDFFNLCVENTDFPIPEFDQIGMEMLTLDKFINPDQGSALDYPLTVGYAPRYAAWKTDIDKSLGAFQTTLQSWCMPYGDTKFAEYNSAVTSGLDSPNVLSDSVTYAFFKVNPNIVNPLFAIAVDDKVDTDCLWCSSMFQCNIVRNLDTNGLPY